MRADPYLFFDGRCEAAFRFYHRCLGGEITAMHKYEGSPAAEHVPPRSRDKIMHARLQVGDVVLMGSDSPAGMFKPPQGVHVSLQVGDAAEAERVFAVLAEHGTVGMPIEETFWAIRFGMLVDQFGIPWMVNCDRPPDQP